MMQGVAVIDAVKQKFKLQINLEAENRQLTEENFRLQTANRDLREVLIENARLRKLLKLKDKDPTRYLVGKVIGASIQKQIRSLIINIGEADSVKKNMAVVNADGLIGKVISTSNHQSIIQILPDFNALVSAKLQNSREVGVISWSGYPWLDLQFISKNIPIEVGELVITSGLSQIYPPGLKIGVVADIKPNLTDIFQEIQVKPAVNFNALDEVFVIRSLATEESSDEP